MTQGERDSDSNDKPITFESEDVDRLVEIFDETVRNIMSNFISNKVITVGDRETIRTIAIIIKVKEKKMLIKKVC